MSDDSDDDSVYAGGTAATPRAPAHDRRVNVAAADDVDVALDIVDAAEAAADEDGCDGGGGGGGDDAEDLEDLDVLSVGGRSTKGLGSGARQGGDGDDGGGGGGRRRSGGEAVKMPQFGLDDSYASDENVLDEEDELGLSSSDDEGRRKVGYGNGGKDGSWCGARNVSSVASSVSVPSGVSGAAEDSPVSASSTSRGDGAGTSRSAGAAAAAAATTPATQGKAFFGGIARAGATFYKNAFRARPAAPVSPVVATTTTLAPKRDLATAAALAASPFEKEEEAQQRANRLRNEHQRYIAMLEAQIATLHGARAGFVDLALLRPMTNKTLEMIDQHVKPLLQDYGQLQLRIAEVERKAAEVARAAEEEVGEKETILIGAKMTLAEVQGDLMNAQHELAMVRRRIADPQLQAAKARADARKLASSAEAALASASAARAAAEANVASRKAKLAADQETTRRLEARLRDTEGDWA